MPVSNSDDGFDWAFLTSESFNWKPAQQWSSDGVRKLLAANLNHIVDNLCLPTAKSACGNVT